MQKLMGDEVWGGGGGGGGLFFSTDPKCLWFDTVIKFLKELLEKCLF